MDKNKVVADRIRKRRLELNMTIDNLAEKTNIGKATIQRYETGATEPTMQKLSVIARFLDVSWAYLLGLESKEISDSSLKLITELFNLINYDIYYDETKEDYFFICSDEIPTEYGIDDILNDDNLEKHHIHPSRLLSLQNEITSFAKYKITETTEELINREKQQSLF